jgi:succinate dehydrogenase/fumarate reductase flavoprotein subunit
MKDTVTSILNLFGTICLLFACGCASHVSKHGALPPSPAAVVKNIDNARTAAADLSKYVAPEGKAAQKKLEESLDSSYRSLLEYSVKVDALSKELVKAQDDAIYWHNKQTKALKELWLWRSIAIASVLAVIGYIGLKTSWRFFL